MLSIFSTTHTTNTEKQAGFVKYSNVIVAEATEKLATAIQEKRDFTQVFYELLDFLGEKRHEIAVAHKDEDAHHFGVRRDLREDSDDIPFPQTTLNKNYLSYNNTLLLELQTHLHTMKHTLKQFQQTQAKMSTPSALNRKTSLEISIFNESNRDSWTPSFTVANCKRLHALISTKVFDETRTPTEFINDLLKNKTALSQLKQASLEDYKKLKLHIMIANIYNAELKGRKTDWVLVTRRAEINGKMYALSQYLTWMNRSYEVDPVYNMTNKSLITIAHQDVFLLKDTLSDIAQLFKQCLEEAPSSLLSSMALFQHQFAHTMPFCRGSAAISEWFEKIMYHHHGLSLAYNETSVNINALTLPLDQFIEQYPSMIKLEDDINLKSALTSVLFN